MLGLMLCRFRVRKPTKSEISCNVHLVPLCIPFLLLLGGDTDCTCTQCNLEHSRIRHFKPHVLFIRTVCFMFRLSDALLYVGMSSLLQLYKTRDEKYLLDLQRVTGPQLLFLELCAAFLAQLRVL
jgi:hypothetical protein